MSRAPSAPSSVADELEQVPAPAQSIAAQGTQTKDSQAAAPTTKKDAFRKVLLQTEPTFSERTIMHTLAGCFNVQYGATAGVNATNEIRTTKYTALTFLPKNLFEQFTRVANLYFLLISGLQLIPGLSPTSWFTTVFPLVCVLAINAIKEAAEDIARHRNDAETNDRKVLLLSRHGRETPTAWRDIRCGHVIKIRQDEEVPADCVVLATSDEAHVCHLETANLDGETNLKLKAAFDGTKAVHAADQLVDFEDRLAIHTEMPNPKLYWFDGAIVDRHDSSTNQLPLNIDNLLLRGMMLRKTSWVIGVVVFTGNDTKIRMNRSKPKRKVTQVERHMNVLVLSMFGVMLLLSIFMALGEQLLPRQQGGISKWWYLEWYGDGARSLNAGDAEWPDLAPGFGAWIIQVIRFLILLNGMIPISLYVTLEMVKVIQCVWILNSDLQMYYRESDTAFKCRTTTLNEDLGQVEYVLSDKTGTLTQNLMGFVWASIDRQLYGKGTTFNTAGGALRKGPTALAGARPAHIPDKSAHTVLLDTMLQAKLGAPFAALAAGAGPGSNGAAGNGAAVPAGALSSGAPDPAVANFFITLAVCNTVVPQVLEDGAFVYQASSPDEEALVEGAAMAGYRLLSRSAQQVEVEHGGARHAYKVLAILDFTSDRKRMSIVCRCPDGKIRLFCKGADTMIMTRVRQGQPIIPTVRSHLMDMAEEGYRTLCIAQKELTSDQWNAWWSTYHAASVALDDREHKVAQAAEKIESELELLGATAVEDKLQDGVPEAIAALVASGIKVWVLTGDKVETAISIAFSCRLFSEKMAIVELRDRDFERALTAAGVHRNPSNVAMPAMGSMEEIVDVEAGVLQQKIDEVEAENIRMEYEAKLEAEGMASQRFSLSRPREAQTKHSRFVGLVVEGGALAVGLQKEHQDKFIQLCSSCRSVVCCRVSPLQKAAVTRLVQVKCQAITLGIGDGANDVGMIQAAHIGCGISGREGRAAVLASDFSFAQFAYLARLLLVHGRSMYRRNVDVVLYSFYKNWVTNMTYIYFAFVTAFSAQPLYTTGLISTFNVFWTSLPIIVYAFTEQEVSQESLMAYPTLYSDTMHATRRDFLLSQLQWIGLATWHSLVVWFVPMYSMNTPDRNGRALNWVEVGCTVYMATILTVNLRLAMRTRYWTWLNHLVIWLSILLYIPFLWLYGLVWPGGYIDGTSNMSKIANTLFPTPQFWLGGVLLAPALSLLLDIAVMSFRRHLRPQHHELVQEAEYLEEVKRQALRELGVGKLSSHRAATLGSMGSASGRTHDGYDTPAVGGGASNGATPGAGTSAGGGGVEMAQAGVAPSNYTGVPPSNITVTGPGIGQYTYRSGGGGSTGGAAMPATRGPYAV